MIFYGAAVLAQTQTGDGNWNDPANWDAGNIGDQITEDVTLDATSTIVSTDSYTIGSLTIINNNGLTIDTGGVLIIGSASDPGAITVNNQGTLQINGDLELFGNLVVENSLDLAITGNFIIHGNVILKNNSVLNVSGNLVVDGDFEAQNNVDFTVDGSVDIGGDITVDKGDLTINTGGSVTVGGSCSWTQEICDSILPVDLLEFSARPVGEVVLVNWATAVEKDNDYFLIQLSTDGQEYRSLTEIEGAGNSEYRLDYSYTDKYPLPGQSYYRLVQVDYNGIRTFFTPVKINREFSGDIGIYPNPVRHNEMVRLYTGGKMDDKVKVTLFSVDGSILWEHGFEGNSDQFAIPGKIKRGVYLLEVRSGGNRKLHRLVLE